MRKRATAALLLGVACSPSGASAPRAVAQSDPGVSTDAGAADAGGGLRVCVYDAKDLAPCAEDCDRRIVFSCAVLAQRLEHTDEPRAVRLYERACELLDAASCVSAARMFASGAGVPPSRARQVELLAQACRLGDAVACAVPARAYETGNGVPRDAVRANELWDRACANGDSSACQDP